MNWNMRNGATYPMNVSAKSPWESRNQALLHAVQERHLDLDATADQWFVISLAFARLVTKIRRLAELVHPGYWVDPAYFPSHEDI